MKGAARLRPLTTLYATLTKLELIVEPRRDQVLGFGRHGRRHVGATVVDVGIAGPTAITQPPTPSGYFDQQIVGLPATIPASVIQSARTASDTIVITPQVLVEGFGSYLEDILPHDIAVTAGAFGASMQQIKNITQIPVEKFAQVVASMETIQGLDLVNGTNVPTDIEEAQIAYELIALGTGPYKTFTYSDFYGCMSGLPYAWQQLQTLLTDLQTNNLTSIYKQLYLAVSWNRATATIQYTDDGFGTYTTTGVTLTNPGGGYGREGAVAPVVTVNGAIVTATIGTDDSNMATFGKVTGLNFAPGTTGSVPTISIDYPPGGSSYPNSVVQGYIDAANAEIALIRTTRPGASVDLNDLYNKFGTQLQNEQLVRNTGLSPLPNVIDPAEARDGYTNKYPIAIYSFVDSLPLLILLL
jgi:hypothetical protein